jgi:hypothetical protein
LYFYMEKIFYTEKKFYIGSIHSMENSLSTRNKKKNSFTSWTTRRTRSRANCFVLMGALSNLTARYKHTRALK